MYVSNIFRRPLPAWAREEVLRHFVAFTVHRDGNPDFSTLTLAKRDVTAVGRPPSDAPCIGQADFECAYYHDMHALDVDPLVSWLCGLVRANEGESWGVAYHLEKVHIDEATALGQARRLVDIQEVYHTRLLGELVGLFGLRLPDRPPPWPLQQAIKVVYRTPDTVSNMMLLGGEIVGTIAFLRMIEEGHALLEAAPETLSDVERILGAILVDEIGHVTLLISLLGGVQLRFAENLARGALKILALDYMRDDRPEQDRYKEQLSKYSLNLFPEPLVRRAFVPAHLVR